jgi:hypothetical protein
MGCKARIKYDQQEVVLMQISRHWRMNAQRYRLEGVRYANGAAHMQPRHVEQQPEAAQVVRTERARASATAAR